MRNLAIALLCVLWHTYGPAQSPFPNRGDGEAPDRTYDVLHYRIELSFDESKRMVIGKTTVTLVPFSYGFASAEFDAEKLSISKVSMGSRDLPFRVGPKSVTVTVTPPATEHDTLAVTFFYTCTPERGLYFVQPDSTNPSRPWQIWSQGEDMDNHFWFPCHDFPDDFATSEVIATVKDTYSALSNGSLVSVWHDAVHHTKTFHWRQDILHATYLIMFAAGEYTIIKDKAGSVPLEYWVYPQNVGDARICFAEIPAMVQWYGSQIGYPYPWAKYAQVLIHNFVVSGMENASATALSDQDAVYGPRARLDASPTSLIAHELAHQWWGDVVTCRDWRHLWLNESFASYFDDLWREHASGHDEFVYRIWEEQQSGINTDRTRGRSPIVSVGSSISNLYPRGAAVLHMLRFVLGDSLFWRSMHYYIVKHQHSPVETNDFKIAIQEATGKNLYWFFDEWLYGAGHPIFQLSWDWNDSLHAVALHVLQTQMMDTLTSAFRTPVNIGLLTSTGIQNSRVEVLSPDTTFIVPAQTRPLTVFFDNGDWILKEVEWQKPAEEWIKTTQLAPDPVERILAIRELARQEGRRALPQLARTAQEDPFWGVRLQAIEAVDSMMSHDSSVPDLTEQMLIRCFSDTKAAVREAAVHGLGGCKGIEARRTLWEALKDSSERVVASALQSLARADSANALPALLASLTLPSRRDVIAAAALGGLASVDSVRAVDSALDYVQPGHPEPMRREALMVLQHHAHSADTVITILLSIVGERRSFLRYQAIRFLGEVGDKRAIPALEKVAEDQNDRAAAAAKMSIRRITKRITPSQ
jgi:aminopeptidase N